jgi:hypothetical protein
MTAESAPLVTVVTPCLNPGWRLLRCIESVASQSYTNIEHVVVDAASSDGTVDLLRSSSVNWVSEPDSGQSEAINKGWFRLGRGEVLTWLNADDVLVHDAVERAVKALGSTPGAGWAYGDIRVDRGADSWVMRAPRRLALDDFRVSNPLPQPGCFLGRWVFDRVGPVDESMHLAMDMDLWVRLLQAGVPHIRIPGILARFEILATSKGGSISYGEFAFEAGRACRKAGLHDWAAGFFGRTAAHRAIAVGSRDLPDAIHQLDRLREETPDADSIPWDIAISTARTELALLTAREDGPAAVRQLFKAEPWRYGEARALLATTMREAVASSRRRPDRGSA